MNNTNINHKHLTLSDRIYIQQGLLEHKTFREIASFLSKDPSTISKEIRRSLDEQSIPHYKGNDCRFFLNCTRSRLCPENCTEFCKYCNDHDCRWLCTDYQPNKCPGLRTPPYVCNGCINEDHCKLDKQYYHAEKAHQQYLDKLSFSRSGINLKPEELQHLNDLISTLIRKGQLEKNHEFIRYVIPKGKSMQNYTQDDITLLSRHINSVTRDSLNENCPFDLAELLLDKKVLAFAGRNKVSPDDVLLKPALFKKKHYIFVYHRQLPLQYHNL